MLYIYIYTFTCVYLYIYICKRLSFWQISRSEQFLRWKLDILAGLPIASILAPLDPWWEDAPWSHGWAMGMAGSVLGKFLRIAFKYRWGPMKIPGRCRRKDLIPGLVNELTVCELENGPVEIVDLPSYKMVIFHSYVSLPEGKWLNYDLW